MEELDPIKLKAELDSFKKEKEKIRQLMGQIGGKKQEQHDRWINRIFILAIILIAINDVLHHVGDYTPPIPEELSLGFAVLLVSIKIIWRLNCSNNWKIEYFCKFPITLILTWNSHNSPSTVGH